MWYTKVYNGEQGIPKLYSTINSGIDGLYTLDEPSTTIHGQGPFPTLIPQGLEDVEFFYGLAFNADGDTYATRQGEDIYFREGAEGEFIALGQTSRDWWPIAVAPNGNVYAAEVLATGGGMFMQTGGIGDFVSLDQTPRNWLSIAVDANNNVYATANGGDMYLQTGGVGDFEPLGLSNAARFVAIHPDGHVYVAIPFAGIYKQIGGIGEFILQTASTEFLGGITCLDNGDVYVTTLTDGKVYKQTRGLGEFKLIHVNPLRTWRTIASYENMVYLLDYGADIYVIDGIVPTYTVQRQGWLYDTTNRPIMDLYENRVENA